MSEGMKVTLVGGHVSSTKLLGPVTRPGCLPGIGPGATQDVMESLGIQTIECGKHVIHLEEARVPAARAIAEDAIARELAVKEIPPAKVGVRYRVMEWDGEINLVTVVKATEDEVMFKYYEDGLVHDVSKEYFFWRMGAEEVV